MAAGRFKVKAPLDVWSTREKLALACSVLRCGDQNWVSVSRSIKQLGDACRSENYFSQKNCAQQYAELLETVETPKRKRGEKEKETVETPQLVIARKLTLERIDELRETLKKEQQEYGKLREDIDKINAGLYDKDLPELVTLIKQDNKPEPEVIKEEKGDGDTLNIVPPLLLKKSGTSTPHFEIKLKIEKEDETQKDEEISVDQVEESTETITPVSVTIIPITPKKEPIEITTPAITPIATPATPIVQLIDEQPSISTTTTPASSVGERISLIKTEPAEDVDVDVMADTSDEGAHMSETPNVSVMEDAEEVFTPQPEVTQPEAEVESEEPVEAVEETTSADTSAVSTQESVSTKGSKDVDDNPPQSPASSIASHDQDSIRTIHSKRGRSRGRKSGRSKKQEKSLERPLVSEFDTSDDDDRSVTSKNESMLDLTPTSPAIHSESEMDEKQYKMWKKSIILVWRAAANHKFAKLFLQPVTESIAPGYHSIIFRPIDLQTIKKKIEMGEIRTTIEFQRDVMLMFTNAMMYNHSDHDVYHMAMDMYNDVMKSIEQYSTTQASAPCETTPTGKVLRQSRRSETQTFSGSERSDKEDDTKKRRQSMEFESGKVKKRKA